MKYFEKYTSNTYASSGNQFYFVENENDVHTGRVFYKISHGGKFNYSLLFSNILDSTYSDGSISRKNLVCDEWEIIEAKVARAKGDLIPRDFFDDETATSVNEKVSDFCQLTFDGKTSKKVAPAEFFNSDEFEMEFESGDYLCLEMTFRGTMMPYHEETLIPVFRKNENGWEYNVRMPLPGMVGCDRKVKARIGYIGDSITQGIGPYKNSYLHWNALISQALGEDYAYWNLGIGFARADDMATDGAWMFKAKNNDIVFVCYGVNDLYNGFDDNDVIRNLNYIIYKLKQYGAKKIILQTLPSFDQEGVIFERWQKVNEYIMTQMVDKVDLVFDDVPILGESEERPQIPKYGGHPNEEGCKLWADALIKEVKKVL